MILSSGARRRPRPRSVAVAALATLALVGIAVPAGVFWSASSTLLRPPGPGDIGDLSACRDETRRAWGEDCGRLSERPDIARAEVSFASVNGYSLSGWKLTPAAASAPRGVVLYVPGGGSDRREASRYVDLVHGLGLDLVVFDPVCHGASPCPVAGLSYGARESRDVRSVATVLGWDYDRVFVMGSSVGALAILRALPDLQVAGIIADSPMLGLDRLLRDAPESRGMPDRAVSGLAALVRLRGDFPPVPEALVAVASATEVPVLLVHSRADPVVPPSHAEELARAYGGPVRLWLSEAGGHGTIWNADPDRYRSELRAFIEPLL